MKQKEEEGVELLRFRRVLKGEAWGFDRTEMLQLNICSSSLKILAADAEIVRIRSREIKNPVELIIVVIILF